jgi:acyl-homoserine-lactone acylase
MRESIHRGAWPRSVLTLAAVAALAACGGSGGGDGSTYSAEIRRTTMGVPHIKAGNWGSAGYGFGYVQAQDNLCTMADSFLTYRGERSRHLGGSAQLVYNSTLGRPRNIDSDFFHRHVISDEAVDRTMAAQPAKLLQMVEGFAAGYNRYVREAKAGGSAHAACRSEAWVQPITARDVWRRIYAANLAGGYSNFAEAIANAQPPQAKAGAQELAAFEPGRTRAPSLQVGGELGVGSNMYGFGTAATGEGSGVLFGNPHWYWKGPDRFYQAQLTIDGEANVSGVSFLGLPVIQIGFNDSVAWSHTVSTARRFGFFQLSLVQGEPTSYLRDGVPVKMKPATITVPSRNADGSVSDVTRTLYHSEFGPLVNLAGLNPALAWSQGTAFAIRDINGENFRTLRTWMRWNQAKSLDEFIAIQKEEASIPWVNTVAVGRGSAKAWYADIGAVPNVSPAQTAACTTPFGMAVGQALPNVPFFDGSRSECDWLTDADSVQKGAVGVSRMPSLQRDDYVGNMNDSYWLANVHAPLTGYPAIFGPAGTSAQTLRTRMGHTMALERLAGTDGYAGNKATSAVVREMVLGSRVFSAERFKDEVLDLICTPAQWTVNGAAVDAAQACAVLAAWNNRGRKDSRGSHLWDEFWSRVPTASLFTVPFSAADPLNTPRGINAAAADALRQAMATAIARVGQSGYALDAPRGEVLYATRGGTRLPLYGGCGTMGYFTITCSENDITQGGYSMDGQPNASNSYMQVVSFPASGVQAHTFPTFSLSDDPASPHHGDYTKAYSAGQWLRVPFTEAEITGNADYRTATVKE